jgi:hypothetical protein
LISILTHFCESAQHAEQNDMPHLGVLIFPPLLTKNAPENRGAKIDPFFGYGTALI